METLQNYLDVSPAELYNSSRIRTRAKVGEESWARSISQQSGVGNILPPAVSVVLKSFSFA